MVAGSRGECRQQQSRVHGPVQPGPAAGVGGRRVDSDATRRRSSGVEDDDHSPVALRPPGPDHDVGAPGSRSPVDGTHVVADHVLTQRVEFGSLAAGQGRQQTVDLAQPGQA